MAEKLVNDGLAWDKKKVKTPDPYVDDGSRYIFPAGEAAPGANIAPAAAQPVPSPEELSAQVANPPVQPQSAPQESFINPGEEPVRQVASAPAQMPAEVPTATTPVSPAPAQDDFMQAREKEIADVGAQEQRLHQERAAAIQKKLDEDEAMVDKIEPKDFFEGKSTWQKVLGGIGMFVGSITPEGARNVANIVEKEINRDLEAQKTNLKLKQNKADKRFQLLIQKYGSEEAALLAKKKTAFDLLDSRLKRMEMAAKSDEARARISIGREELQIKRDQLKLEAGKAMMKAQQDQNKGSIPGYLGSNQNPAIVKEATERTSAAKSAQSTISKLESLLQEGSLAPLSSNRATAKQLRQSLAADLAKAMFGRSSDAELEMALDLIPDITSLTQGKAVDKKLFNSLRNKLATDLDAYLSTAGFSRARVPGAREIK